MLDGVTEDPALLYARISDDDLGDEAGVTRQVEDGRALAAARALRVVGVHSDNDISALRGKRRPGYEDLMAAVVAGHVGCRSSGPRPGPTRITRLQSPNP